MIEFYKEYYFEFSLFMMKATVVKSCKILIETSF